MTEHLTSGQLLRDINNGFNKLQSNPCGLCKQNEDKVYNDGAMIHFHGSDWGKCRRMIQYNIMFPEKISSDKDKFFFDGHLHEESIIRALRSMGYFIDFTYDQINEKINNVPGSLLFNNIPLNFNIASYAHQDKFVNIQTVVHPDGIITHNKEKVLIECKAVKNYSFPKYKEGFIPPTYFGQMQAYLHVFKLERGFLIVKNRDTSDISPPLLVKADPEFVKKKIIELTGIIKGLLEDKLIKRPYDNNKNFECKYCTYKERCWR